MRINIEIKKIIALAFTILFCIISLIGFIYQKTTFSEISTPITMVIGYYFGHKVGQETSKDI